MVHHHPVSIAMLKLPEANLPWSSLFLYVSLSASRTYLIISLDNYHPVFRIIHLWSFMQCTLYVNLTMYVLKATPGIRRKATMTFDGAIGNLGFPKLPSGTPIPPSNFAAAKERVSHISYETQTSINLILPGGSIIVQRNVERSINISLLSLEFVCSSNDIHLQVINPNHIHYDMQWASVKSL